MLNLKGKSHCKDGLHALLDDLQALTCIVHPVILTRCVYISLGSTTFLLFADGNRIGREAFGEDARDFITFPSGQVSSMDVDIGYVTHNSHSAIFKKIERPLSPL